MVKGDKREGAGRKALSGATKLASFDIDAEEWRQSGELAARDGKTRAEYLRELIKREMALKAIFTVTSTSISP